MIGLRFIFGLIIIVAGGVMAIFPGPTLNDTTRVMLPTTILCTGLLLVVLAINK